MIEIIKSKGGKPPVVLTAEQIEKVEDLSAYLTTEQIADYFGFDRNTFYEIRKRQPEVSRHYKKGKVHKIVRYAKKLETKAMGDDESGDTTAIIFFLKTQGRWSSANNDNDEPINHIVIDPVKAKVRAEMMEERIEEFNQRVAEAKAKSE